jgi:hypothetical protein
MPETDGDVSLPIAFETLIESVLSEFGVEVAGEIEATEIDDGYEAAVPIDGRLLLAEVTEYQGRLLAFQGDREIMLRGFEDDRVVLTAKVVKNP